MLLSCCFCQQEFIKADLGNHILYEHFHFLEHSCAICPYKSNNFVEILSHNKDWSHQVNLFAADRQKSYHEVFSLIQIIETDAKKGKNSESNSNSTQLVERVKETAPPEIVSPQPFSQGTISSHPLSERTISPQLNSHQTLPKKANLRQTLLTETLSQLDDLTSNDPGPSIPQQTFADYCEQIKGSITNYSTPSEGPRKKVMKVVNPAPLTVRIHEASQVSQSPAIIPPKAMALYKLIDKCIKYNPKNDKIFTAQSVKNKYCLFTLKDGTRIKASLPSDDDRDIEDCSLCGEPVFQSYIARRNHVLNKHCMKDLNIDSTEQEVLVPALFLTIKNCFPNARVINDFSCVVCNRIYKTIDTRRDHIGRFHHNGRQFCCVVKGCNYHFTAIFQLRNHFKSCHIGFDKAALNEFLVQEKAVLMQVESHYFPADLAIYKKSIENIYIQVKLIAKSDDTEMHQENDESVSSSIEANESSHENSVTPSNNSPITSPNIKEELIDNKVDNNTTISSCLKRKYPESY